MKPPAALLLEGKRHKGKSKPVNTSSGLSRPSEETFRQSRMLDDHNAVLEIFTSYLDSTNNKWPSKDKIEDQLNGYAPTEFSANNKRPRLVMRSTLPAIGEGDEVPLRARTGL